MATVAVTGVTGFIGSNLAKKLVELGYCVFGVTRHCASRTLKPIEEILDDIVLLSADVTDFRSTLNALKTANPDYICHLAALTPVRLSFEKPFDCERINYFGAMNVAHATMELPDYKERRLIFASTPEVYGIHACGKALNENTLFRPSSPYAVSKAAADMYIRMLAFVCDLNAVVLRPANTYGRKFEKEFMVEYLITSMLGNKKVYVGAPESIREYLYVEDHVEAYIRAMENGMKGEAYNIGRGEGIKNRELAEKIAEKTGYDVNRMIFGSYPPGYPSRPILSDQPHIILDCTKAKKELGWSPRVTLDEGLERAIEYWKLLK